jgi:hypothetical protein
MFRALLAHLQEALHKRHLVYCVHVMSLAAIRIGVEPILKAAKDITHMQYTKCHLCSASWGWASNAWNTQRPLILNRVNKKYITLFSLYWYTVMYGQPNINLVIHSSKIKTCQTETTIAAGPPLTYSNYQYNNYTIYSSCLCLWLLPECHIVVGYQMFTEFKSQHSLSRTSVFPNLPR